MKVKIFLLTQAKASIYICGIKIKIRLFFSKTKQNADGVVI